MFGLDSIPPAFVSRVLEDAAGSPFFLEEVVRGLVENGLGVRLEHGAWQTASALGELEIPQTIVAALRRRLATIESEATLELLRLLAVYKKPMSASLLAAAADTSTEKRSRRRCTDLALRQMVTVVDSSERLFSHGGHNHLRTTVYHDIADDARRVHLKIARGLERIADADHPQLSELAHHYWAANDTDRALKYALLAGRAASRIYANDEAIEHLEHALELLPSQARERSDALEQLADAYFLSGHYERTGSLLAELESKQRRHARQGAPAAKARRSGRIQRRDAGRSGRHPVAGRRSVGRDAASVAGDVPDQDSGRVDEASRPAIGTIDGQAGEE